MDRKIAFALVRELEANDATSGTPATQAVTQSLRDAFDIDTQSAAQRCELQLSPSLSDIFNAGAAALNAKTESELEAEARAEFEGNAFFTKYMETITNKGFFNEVQEGSPEYTSRFVQAVSRFRERMAQRQAAATTAAPAPAAATPVEDTASAAERQEQAERKKKEGNDLLSQKRYEEAIAKYDEAIALSSDGPKSHIYFANKSAALSHLARYSEAADACHRAIELNPGYSKAHSRLGFAYTYLDRLEDACDAYRRALEADPNNALAREQLADVEQRIAQRQTQGAGGPGAGGMPDLSALAGMMGGAGGAEGLAGLMQNPAMMQMAQQFMAGGGMEQMMQNPAMMQMAQQMMSNPDALQGLLGGLGGGGGGGGAPDLSALAGMMGGMGGAGMGGAGMGGAGMPGASAPAPAPAAAAPASAQAAAGLGGMLSPENLDRLRERPEVAELLQDPKMAALFADVQAQGPSGAMAHMQDPYVAGKLQTLMQTLQQNPQPE